MNEKDLLWNKFIEEVCYREINTLNDVQRKAVLCFWYDAEMNSGGFSGYLDCYADTDIHELKEAISIIGTQEIVDNLQKAISYGKEDDYIVTDSEYYNFMPSLSDYLEEYVENNKDNILE